MKKLITLLFVVFTVTFITAQGVVKGTVKDSDTQEGLIGASVVIKNSDKGTITDVDGNFALEDVSNGTSTIVISYIGYDTKEIEVTMNNSVVDLGTISLKPMGIGLEEINIVASIAQDRRTPVAVSTLNARQIEANLGSSELPEVLNVTPGVYATKSGGGFGDSRINIRGFDQRNVAVLINGIPVNDMENGWVYWSNWAGLGDAVSTIQVQRGLGASRLAINSVGGTMNIITKTADAKKGGSIKYELASYGKKKALISLSTGKMDNGTSISFVGSRTFGNGFVDGTYIDAWSYYLGIYKEINAQHSLQFTVIGAPQKHGQRDGSKYSAQKFSQYERNGSSYNPNWGYAKGEFLNERNNYYHKPQIALNHYWTVNDNNFLATSFYISTGTGGGSGILGRNPIKYGPGQNELGQRNWDRAIAMNDTSSTGAFLIMRNSVNNHFWTGLLSTLKSDISDNLHFIGGLDARHYQGEHYREVRDLLGASHWVDKVNPEAKEGDTIAYNNIGYVTYGGLFSQLEFTMDNLSAFIGGTVSATNYGRKDVYNYQRGKIDKPEAEKVKQLGFNVKTGFNFNINPSNNIFVNAGYYSRAPFHNFVYVNYGNTINSQLEKGLNTKGNEKVLGLEAGYGLNMSMISFKVNGYYTVWQDRWVKQYVDYIDNGGNSKKATAYFQVPEEPHLGVEFELKAKPIYNLELGILASIGDWKYKGDFDVDIFDEGSREKIGSTKVYADGLHVPDQAQTQIGAQIVYSIGDFEFGFNYTSYDKLYAKFEVAANTSSDDKKDSYRLPSYGILDGRASYKFMIGGLKSKFYINGYNLLNTHSPVEGWGFDKDGFRGFWTWDRNFNFGLKVNF